MSKVTIYYPNNNKKINDVLYKDINLKSVDVLNIKREDDKNTIGIDKIREAITFLQQRPYNSKYKHIIIKDAHLLTIEAQNAFLKTLEEPSEYADIRLGTKTLNDLLDTFLSRCKKINIANNKNGVGDISEKSFKENIKNSKKDDLEYNIEDDDKNLEEFTYTNFFVLDTGAKLDFVQKMSKLDKHEIINILEEWIKEDRKVLLNKIKDKKAFNNKFLEQLNIVLTDYKKYNLNTKFVLEYLVISSS